MTVSYILWGYLAVGLLFAAAICVEMWVVQRMARRNPNARIALAKIDTILRGLGVSFGVLVASAVITWPAAVASLIGTHKKDQRNPMEGER